MDFGNALHEGFHDAQGPRQDTDHGLALRNDSLNGSEQVADFVHCLENVPEQGSEDLAALGDLKHSCGLVHHFSSHVDGLAKGLLQRGQGRFHRRGNQRAQAGHEGIGEKLKWVQCLGHAQIVVHFV